jgi:hypothetical protein
MNKTRRQKSHATVPFRQLSSPYIHLIQPHYPPPPPPPHLHKVPSVAGCQRRKRDLEIIDRSKGRKAGDRYCKKERGRQTHKNGE